MGRMRAPLAVAIVMMGTVALSGCSAAGAGPARTATTTPVTAETPAPQPAVDAIVVAGDGLHLHAGGATLSVLDYRHPAEDVLSRLTEVLGAPTATREQPATNHTKPSTVTEFGGLAVVAPHYDEPVTNDYKAQPAWYADVTTASAGAVALRTTAGDAVGAPFADATSAVGEWDAAWRLEDGRRQSATLVETSPDAPAEVGETPGVIVIGDPDGGAISRFYAPGTLSAP